MSVGGALPRDSNTRPPRQTVASTDSQPQATSYLSQSSDYLLHGFDNTANVLEEKQDQIIEECNQSLQRQEQSVEETRKQLENLKIRWSSEAQAIPSDHINIPAAGARKDELIAARSKDLAGERKQFLGGWGTRSSAPLETRPLGNVYTRLDKGKERERIEETKNEPTKEIIGQPGPSRLPHTKVRKDHDIRQSYPILDIPSNSFCSVPAWSKNGYPASESPDHMGKGKKVQHGPYPLGSFRRSNADLKVPQVSHALRPKFSALESSDKSDAFPLLPSPSYGYDSKNSSGESGISLKEIESNTSDFSKIQWQSISAPRKTQEHKQAHKTAQNMLLQDFSNSDDLDNTTPSELTLCEQNKIQRELRETEERGEKGINESKGLFWGYSEVPMDSSKPQGFIKSSQTSVSGTSSAPNISPAVPQAAIPSRKPFKFSRNPMVECYGDDLDDDLTMLSVKRYLKHTLVDEETSQATEKKQKRQERMDIGNVYVPRQRESSNREFERAMASETLQKSSARQQRGAESDFADDEQEFENVRLKDEEMKDAQEGSSEEEDWIVV
jgi:uncharacterized coiled-coil protein SlyX